MLRKRKKKGGGRWNRVISSHCLRLDLAVRWKRQSCLLWAFVEIHRNAVTAINMKCTEVMLGARICLQACIKGLELYCLTQNCDAEGSEKWKKCQEIRITFPLLEYLRSIIK